MAEDVGAKTVVLVHGGFVDGSGWEGVYNILRKDGYTVAVVQNPTISLADDVAVTKRVIDAQAGLVVLVGHSYGGAVITEAGNDPKVAGFVYITAFAPDKGESVNSLIKDPPPDAPVPPILPPQDGYLFLDKTKFAASFAADVDPEKAAFMAVVGDGDGNGLAASVSFTRLSARGAEDLRSNALSDGFLPSVSSTAIEADAEDRPVSPLFSLFVGLSRLTGSPAARRCATTSSRL